MTTKEEKKKKNNQRKYCNKKGTFVCIDVENILHVCAFNGSTCKRNTSNTEKNKMSDTNTSQKLSNKKMKKFLQK